MINDWRQAKDNGDSLVVSPCGDGSVDIEIERPEIDGYAYYHLDQRSVIELALSLLTDSDEPGLDLTGVSDGQAFALGVLTGRIVKRAEQRGYELAMAELTEAAHGLRDNFSYKGRKVDTVSTVLDEEQ